MKIFYGVYLENSKLSTAFDIIRYLAEPDNLRFSHITLRGPYSKALSPITLAHLREGNLKHWAVRLDGADKFFEHSQSTVLIKIDLLDLKNLLHKPDFVDGIPHLTLYDGSDREFAFKLLSLLYKYDFHQNVMVTPLIKISSKAPIAGEFHKLYDNFSHFYYSYVGQYPSKEHVKNLSLSEKLTHIDNVLRDNFTSLYSRLNQKPYPIENENLSFDFDYISTSKKK